MLIVKNLKKNFIQGNENIEVINDISFKISKKKNIGLIGPSGSGKSTLLNIIGLIETATSGLVNINGVDCSNLSQDKRTIFRREHVGFIFQSDQLLDDFSCEENIALPLILNGCSYKTSIQKSRIYLEKLGLEKKNKMKPTVLSGGEKQRVAIIRALIKNPAILLSDEPTGSLDKKNTLKVFEEILKLTDDKETITITATHNLNLLDQFDLCYEMKDGKLIEFK